MEIYVLVKQVPDPEAIVRVKSETELEIENKYFTSFFDEVGIEAGLRLKEKLGGKVTVLTVDSKRVDALRRGISMGADEAFQIADPALEGSDPFGTARALAAFLKARPFDGRICDLKCFICSHGDSPPQGINLPVVNRHDGDLPSELFLQF